MNKEKQPASDDKNQDLLNEYLKEINQAEITAAEAFDKQVLGLSSGALGLSITFLTKFAVSETSLIFLKISWVLFIFTISLTVLSYFIRLSALNWQVEKVETYFLTSCNEYPSPKNNPYAKALSVLSWFVAVFFLLGIILTALSIGGPNVQEKNNKEIRQEIDEKSCKEGVKKGGATSSKKEVTTDEK